MNKCQKHKPPKIYRGAKGLGTPCACASSIREKFNFRMSYPSQNQPSIREKKKTQPSHIILLIITILIISSWVVFINKNI